MFASTIIGCLGPFLPTAKGAFGIFLITTFTRFLGAKRDAKVEKHAV